MNIFKYCFFFILSLLIVESLAQESDSVDDYAEEEWYEDDDSDGPKNYYKKFDSLSVDVRAFDPEKISRLKEDPELNYNYTTTAISLWDRFWAWFWDQISEFFQTSGDINWFRFLTYTLFVILLVYVIMRLLKLDALKVLYGTTGKKKIDHLILDENIHEMDFEKLLDEAIQTKAYRLAIRLLFLYGLKMLSDKQHIYWEPGKTNHDYLIELKTKELKADFHQLNYYFEYSWYGHFDVSPEFCLQEESTPVQSKQRVYLQVLLQQRNNRSVDSTLK